MDAILRSTKDSGWNHSTSERDTEINRQIEDNILYYGMEPPEVIKGRLDELDKEWDVERTLELNASLIGLTGVLLSAAFSKKWLFLPAIASFFLAQQAIRGWCPPVGLMRSRNMRTRKEIARERMGLLEALKKGTNKTPAREWNDVR